MTRKTAATYLGVSSQHVRGMIKRNILKIDDKNKLIPEQVEEVRIQLEERRRTPKPVWVNRNSY
jgi:hypothetical protein